MMAMPPTIRVVAMSRKASILLPGCHTRNIGKTRFRIRAYANTKMGRVLIMVETSDTGPLAIDQNDSIMATGTRSSLKASRAIAEFLCLMLISCLRMWGRIETSKKVPDMQNAVSQVKFQNEMEARTYLLVISPIAKSRLEPKKRINILPSQVVEPDGLCPKEMVTAPATTIIIASHSR